MSKTVVLDSGVVIAMLSPTDAFHTAAAQAVQRREAEGCTLVISAAAWSEVMVGAIRRGAVADAERFLRVLDGIVDVDQEIAERAAELRAKDLALRFPDAFMAATAQTYDDGVLITTDATLTEKVAPELVELVTA